MNISRVEHARRMSNEGERSNPQEQISYGSAGEGPVVDEMSTTVPDRVAPVLGETMEDISAASSGAPEETQ